MRIYEGSPRQDWEEVLRSIGAWADREFLKELLFLELEGGFLIQALSSSQGGQWSEQATYTKVTHELTDEQVAQLMDEAANQRGTDANDHPEVGVANFYEQALRIVGKWLDGTEARDVFFFEQGGSFVVRTYVVSQGGKVGHQLAEFTRDQIVGMIEAAPLDRGPAPVPPASAEGTGSGESGWGAEPAQAAGTETES